MDIAAYLRKTMGMLPSDHVNHEMEEIEQEENVSSETGQSDDILFKLTAELGEDALEHEIEGEDEETNEGVVSTIMGPIRRLFYTARVKGLETQGWQIYNQGKSASGDEMLSMKKGVEKKFFSWHDKEKEWTEASKTQISNFPKGKF